MVVDHDLRKDIADKEGVAGGMRICKYKNGEIINDDLFAEEKNKILAKERNKVLAEERNKVLAEEKNKVLAEERNKALERNTTDALKGNHRIVPRSII